MNLEQITINLLLLIGLKDLYQEIKANHIKNPHSLDTKYYMLDRGNLSIEEKDVIIRSIVEAKPYNTENRKPRKMTDEIKDMLEEIAKSETEKSKILGSRHKQKLDGKRVHELLIEAGHDISYRTMMTYWKSIIEKAQEVFIRQEYPYGGRLEFDFGEVKLYINGEVEKTYIAVFTAPASGFRWAYLYKNQKMEVFLDAHVQFFEMIKGVYQDVVYDNMRNVVSKFTGRGKELNQQLVQMSLYYGFDIITTNAYSGNEKGSVERSVEVIRKRLFTKKYKFDSFEQAQQHLRDKLVDFNQESEIETEKISLGKYKVPYELSQLVEAKVNKYSCVTLDNNHYSVPDYLTEKVLKVKKYHDHYDIYANNNYVCSHKKIDGVGHYQLVLNHYLKTLRNKPGAVKHSLALKQCPELYSIYQTYFKRNERLFIDILLKNSDKELETIKDILLGELGANIKSTHNSKEVVEATKQQLEKLNSLFGFNQEEGEETACQLKH